ncbi:hypothetical protein [Streptomyces sp. MA5143a]|uniref:hypothetical protein n=1 Tax=Streptomyces sp. MA5143a TaxID=2083010 RepID=UPI000D1BFC41|nr:hypothetical protein [Streptomyces sp. MA5143a]SPF00297.1 hypothetical protein SMA5143A_1008 [Streptomyces sp. MA5143a]
MPDRLRFLVPGTVHVLRGDSGIRVDPPRQQAMPAALLRRLGHPVRFAVGHRARVVAGGAVPPATT